MFDREGIIMSKPKIIIAADHAGLDLKAQVAQRLMAKSFDVTDLGTHTKESVNYPDYANLVAAAVLAGKGEFGILICGSGIGMCMSANRHKGIRAALCWNAESAKLSRQHNDANIICLGARLISPETAMECVEVFLNTAFEGGRHLKRVEMMG